MSINVKIDEPEPHTQLGAGGLLALPPLALSLGLGGEVSVHPRPHLQVEHAGLLVTLGQILQNYVFRPVDIIIRAPGQKIPLSTWITLLFTGHQLQQGKWEWKGTFYVHLSQPKYCYCLLFELILILTRIL